MASMGGDQRQRMEAAAEDKFPEGLRVLAVDDDRVCLKVLEALLRSCKYHPTTVMDAKSALKMLRSGKNQFDLVITDVHMPDMDGFKLLDLIRLEMEDLPVIMLSVDHDRKAVMKGINHGACDYLVKPVHTNDLKYIWQHVERRTNPNAISNISSDDDDDDDDDQRVQQGTSGKSMDSCNKTNGGDDSKEKKESTHVSKTQKKPRVDWKDESLHKKFLEAINQTGIDKATPKKILELMNMDGITRESIASHLQKYRLSLRSVCANTSGDGSERRKSCYNINNQGGFMHNDEHETWHVSLGDLAYSRPKNYSATTNLAQPTNIQSNFYMGSFLHGGRRSGYVVPESRDARTFTSSGNNPASLYNNIPNERIVDEFPSDNSSNSYVNIIRDLMLETSKIKTSPNQGSYASGGKRSIVPSQVDIPRINHLGSYAISSSQLPPQNEMAPFIRSTTSVRGLNEQMIPINIPNNPSSVRMVNTHSNARVTPSHMVNGGRITTSVACCSSEQMTPFNIGMNTSSVGMMLKVNSTPGASRTSLAHTHMVNSGRTTPSLSDLQTSNFIAVTQKPDGEDATGILPTQEGTLDQQPPNDQVNENISFSMDELFF